MSCGAFIAQLEVRGICPTLKKPDFHAWLPSQYRVMTADASSNKHRRQPGLSDLR